MVKMILQTVLQSEKYLHGPYDRWIAIFCVNILCPTFVCLNNKKKCLISL